MYGLAKLAEENKEMNPSITLGVSGLTGAGVGATAGILAAKKMPLNPLEQLEVKANGESKLYEKTPSKEFIIRHQEVRDKYQPLRDEASRLGDAGDYVASNEKWEESRRLFNQEYEQMKQETDAMKPIWEARLNNPKDEVYVEAERLLRNGKLRRFSPIGAGIGAGLGLAGAGIGLAVAHRNNQEQG
jgi:hypothetical protein